MCRSELKKKLSASTSNNNSPNNNYTPSNLFYNNNRFIQQLETNFYSCLSNKPTKQMKMSNFFCYVLFLTEVIYTNGLCILWNIALSLNHLDCLEKEEPIALSHCDAVMVSFLIFQVQLLHIYVYHPIILFN